MINCSSGFSEIGGIDYSQSLCAIAKAVLPNADILTQNAQDLDTKIQYDCITSFSVFHYFENLTYAKEVAHKMIAKARKKILFLDILDSKKQSQDMEYKIKAYGEDTYKRLYCGKTKHLYYDKSFFMQLADSFNLQCEIKDQQILGYKNSDFRFNCIMSKK